jgi:hypothetical protein
VLNATFNNNPSHTFVNATIQGVDTWNLQAADPFIVVAINGGPNVSGLLTANMINSSANSEIRIGVGGSGFQPLSFLVPTIGATNDGAGGEFQVIQDHTLFTSTTSVQVNLSNVGGPPPTPPATDDKINGFAQSFEVSYGPDQGWINRTGAAIWNINSAGNANFLDIGTNGSNTATAINFRGTAPLTVFANTNTDWVNLATVNGAGLSGTTIVTGALNGVNGLLDDAPVLTSIILGSGNNNFADLSAYTIAQLDAMTAINGGSGTGESLPTRCSPAWAGRSPT